jgi:uncharacterized protein DUF4397
MRVRMWRLVLVAVAGLGVAAAGCKSNNNGTTAPSNLAQVRFFHAAPTVPTQIDAYVNDSLVVSDVHYGHGTTYLGVPPGTDTIKITHIQATTSLLTTTESVSAAHTYTFFDVGDSTVSALLAADSNTSAGAGTIKLRVIHAAPSKPSVDLYLSAAGAPLPATPTVAGIPFPHISRYFVLGAGSYEVRVTAAGSRTVVADETLTNLASGAVRTIVVVDAPGGGAPVSGVILPDAG